jgi:hypothetical protein
MIEEEQETDPSEEAGKTVDDLEDQSEKLGGEIDETRSDWESKKESSGVPGAVPDPDADPDPETDDA